MSWTRRRTLSALGLVGAGASLTGLAACTDEKKTPGAQDSNGGKAEGKARVTITSPAADAKDVPASAEIVFSATEAKETTVELKSKGGKAVDGAPHPDGKGWLPAATLEYGETYTATVTATDADGKPTTANSTFTVMAKPSKQVRFVSFLADGAVVGVGMPLIIQLSRAIPKDQRADVQRRLLVSAEPAQDGIWTWYTDTELHWRPKEFWQAGTKVRVDLRVGGLPCGDGYFGRTDLSLDCSIGPALVMTVDDKASPKVMTVTKDGAVLKKIPVSLGRPGMPSSSGTMVVIEKFAKTVFDTRTDPNPANRYRVDIDWAQRLTWGGEFIHSAPWSVSDQGKRNVSHGCINMSAANAKWLFQQTRIGDPVVVKGTSRQLKYGNGWTDFTKSWDEYVEGSAIPYESSASPEPTPS
ncbi:Ig-like domain-containing protein [Hamadaea sp. NPDC051192]|uniref:L,D-transpeptidase n=1 Tax=Hamadaea sp. NPDC051192 TaxID=3154940 RepID=UPI00344910BE